MAKKRNAKKFVETPEPELDDDDDVGEPLEYSPTLTDNADAVPLFADIDGRTSRSITQLRLLRVEQGGVAYKGMIPITSTLDTIGQIYGNGIYTLEGLNAKGAVLHSKENLRISLPELEDAHNKDLEGDANRIERLARQSANESVAQARTFLELIVTQTNAQQQRERDFYAAQQSQQQVFMAALLTAQSAQFTQTIQMITQVQEGRRQELKQLPKQQNDSALLMETLMRGLKLGRDLSNGKEPEQTPVWQEILKGGLGVLSQVQTPQQTSAALPTTSATKPTTPPPTALPGLSSAQRKLVRDALRLHKAVRSKGIDPQSLTAELLQNASTSVELVEGEPERLQVVPPPPDDEDDDESDDDDDESDDLDDESEDDDLDDDDDDSTEADDSDESAGVGA